MQIQLESIGTIQTKKGFAVTLASKWRAGLAGLDGFGHVVVLWHAHQAAWSDEHIRVKQPYRGGPDETGLFATRSPLRPNGICVSVAALVSVDMDTGTAHLAWIDAEDDSPVIDMKPYHPSSDRVERPRTPPWCASWPKSLEQSASFDWSKVFNF
ncbi:MAG: TrmO family methyltransferase [Polyangiaceae bacterium]